MSGCACCFWCVARLVLVCVALLSSSIKVGQSCPSQALALSVKWVAGATGPAATPLLAVDFFSYIFSLCFVFPPYLFHFSSYNSLFVISSSTRLLLSCSPLAFHLLRNLLGRSIVSGAWRPFSMSLVFLIFRVMVRF